MEKCICDAHHDCLNRHGALIYPHEKRYDVVKMKKTGILKKGCNA
jgi:hypothetical protein